MTPLTDYDTLAALASAHMRRGVLANTMVTREEYGPSLAEGALTAADSPAGLFLLRNRGGHHRLTFLLNDLTAPLAPLSLFLPSPTVTEIAFRPGDIGLQKAVAYWEGQGFVPLLYRVRLSRKAGPVPEGPFPAVITPGPQRAKDVLALLEASFSPLTGCLPNRAELEEALAKGQVLATEAGGSLTGLLHFSPKGGEIRHLAVRADCRGQGLSRPLLAAYLQSLKGAKAHVWTGEENTAALAAYAAFDFVPDGRRSAVLCYTGSERKTYEGTTAANSHRSRSRRGL